MEYKDLLRDAKANGVASEKTMWLSVDSLSDMLCVLKEEHPEMYWRFIREQHGIMYNNHYDRNFAEMDVEKIRYTNREGRKCDGAHWTSEQIELATKSLPFPANTTKWDKYVAFNAMYSDLCTVLDDDSVIKTAHRFYFLDEDSPQGKIWIYMTAMMYEK